MKVSEKKRKQSSGTMENAEEKRVKASDREKAFGRFKEIVKEKPLKIRSARQEKLAEVGRDAFGWLVVTAISFLYSVIFLLFLSLILLNVWKVTFDEIIQYSSVITVICSVAYMVKIVYSRVR